MNSRNAMISRRSFLWQCGTSSLALGAASRAWPQATPARGKPLAALTIGAATAIDHTTMWSALEKGIFEKYGLDAKINMYTSGTEIINALNSGQVGVGVFGSVTMLTAVYRGLPLLLIALNHGDATLTWYNANEGVVAGPKAGIREGQIALFKGKKVALPLANAPEPYFKGLLRMAGLSDKDVQIVNIKPADAIPALMQGSIDGFSLWEPWVSMAVAQIPGAVRVMQGNSPDWYDPGTTVSTRAFVDKNPDVIRRFLAASAESHQWVRRNLDEAAVIATRWITGLDEKVAKLSVRNSVYDIRLSKCVYEGYRDKTIPFLASIGLLKPFDPEKAIEPKFILEVEKAHPEFFTDLPPISPDKRL